MASADWIWSHSCPRDRIQYDEASAKQPPPRLVLSLSRGSLTQDQWFSLLQPYGIMTLFQVRPRPATFRQPRRGTHPGRTCERGGPEQNGSDPESGALLGVVAVRMASYRSARYILQHLNMLAIGTSTLTVEFDGAGTCSTRRRHFPTAMPIAQYSLRRHLFLDLSRR